MTLDDSPQSSEFSSALTKTPLRFGFDDGRVSEVCGSSQEESWVTNFKRGVLSTFQNTMTKFDEDEVSQLCLIVTLISVWNSTVIATLLEFE